MLPWRFRALSRVHRPMMSSAPVPSSSDSRPRRARYPAEAGRSLEAAAAAAIIALQCPRESEDQFFSTGKGQESTSPDPAEPKKARVPRQRHVCRIF